jgi:hypothetical protein
MLVHLLIYFYFKLIGFNLLTITNNSMDIKRKKSQKRLTTYTNVA